MGRLKRSTHPHTCILLLLMYALSVSGWFFAHDSSAERENLRTEHAPISEKAVPFEMQTTDEKFLLQAKFVADLSPLDLCHHMVVSEITGTCSDMSEEQLNKLAVMLLNCQSESENRPTFPCTAYMSIAECTQDMDPTTWNAYQIVANRARALCYSTRQQSFRMKTEHTVNQLVTNTQQQARAVKEIQVQQEEVSKAAQQTLQQVSEGQQQLQAQQQQTVQTQQHLHSSLALNLRSLAREKALIAAGHTEIAHMTQDIRNKLDETSTKLDGQAQKQEENHQRIAADLADIQTRAKEVFSKIDESSKNVLDLQSESERHYKHTLDNLEKVNNTINYALATLEDMKFTVERKLNWLLELVGGSGERVGRLLTVALHAGYLLLVMVSASFLRTPTFSRLVLLLVVPVNAWSELQHRRSLTFLPMTLFILLTVIANYVAGWLLYLITSKRSRPKLCDAPLQQQQQQQQQQQLQGGLHQLAACDCTSHTNNDDKASSRAPGSGSNGGLSAPDVHRLIETLEKLYESGVLLPGQGRDTTPPEPLNPANTPATKPRPYVNLEEKSGAGGDGLLGKSLFAHQPTSKPDPHDLSTALFTPYNSEKKAPPRDSPRLSVVKRHLLKSGLSTPPGSPAAASSPDTTPLCSPGHTPDATPLHTPPGTPPGTPRHSTPVRSILTPLHNLSRPQCLAATKNGLPCKNSSMEGSGFCRRHQTTPVKGGTPKRTPRGTLGFARGTPKATPVRAKLTM